LRHKRATFLYPIGGALRKENRHGSEKKKAGTSSAWRESSFVVEFVPAPTKRGKATTGEKKSAIPPDGKEKKPLTDIERVEVLSVGRGGGDRLPKTKCFAQLWSGGESDVSMEREEKRGDALKFLPELALAKGSLCHRGITMVKLHRGGCPSRGKEEQEGPHRRAKDRSHRIETKKRELLSCRGT